MELFLAVQTFVICSKLFTPAVPLLSFVHFSFTTKSLYKTFTLSIQNNIVYHNLKFDNGLTFRIIIV